MHHQGFILAKNLTYKTRHESQKRTIRVEITLTPDEKAQIDEQAKRYGRSVADTIRRGALGVRMASPPSAENFEQWKTMGKVSQTINMFLRHLHRAHQRLDEKEVSGRIGKRDLSAELEKILSIAEHYEAKMEELIPVIVEIRELLIDQWEENKREALEE